MPLSHLAAAVSKMSDRYDLSSCGAARGSSSSAARTPSFRPALASFALRLFWFFALRLCAAGAGAVCCRAAALLQAPRRGELFRGMEGS